jgi:hypothetical protein
MNWNKFCLVAPTVLGVAFAIYMLVTAKIERSPVDARILCQAWEYLAGRAEPPEWPYSILRQRAILLRAIILKAYSEWYPGPLARWVTLEADIPSFHPAVFETAATMPIPRFGEEPTTFFDAVQRTADLLDSGQLKSDLWQQHLWGKS